jgi:hypothetical protein
VYVCGVSLAEQWEALRNGWSDARIRVTVEEPERADRAAQLLGPLQPIRPAPGVLTFSVVGHSDVVRRLLERLDAERIHATLEVVDSDPIVVPRPAKPQPTLRESWEAALATLPADWSDLLGEVELGSSDWIDKAAVNMVPMNPRRDGVRLAFRFRSARRHGYGAAPEMVARCLARCDDDGIRGTVLVLRALSDTNPVSTQGPVWQLDGKTV